MANIVGYASRTGGRIGEGRYKISEIIPNVEKTPNFKQMLDQGLIYPVFEQATEKVRTEKQRKNEQ